MSNLNDPKVYLAAVAVAIVSILPFNEGFYVFTRLVITLCSGLAVKNLLERKDSLWIVFGLILVLYNPVIPVHLREKAVWALANILTALLFLLLYRRVSNPAPFVSSLVQWVSRAVFLLFCFGPIFSLFVAMVSEGGLPFSVDAGRVIQTILIGVGIGVLLSLAINRAYFRRWSVWAQAVKKDPSATPPP
jgi:hypothetical protein